MSFLVFMNKKHTNISVNPPIFEICPGLHSVRCKLISISVTKCPLTFLVNSTITVGEKYGEIKATKCAPNYTARRVISSSPHPNLKIVRKPTLNLKSQTGGLCLDLAEHFVIFIKIERASRYVDFWTNRVVPRSPRAVTSCITLNSVEKLK